MSRLKSLTMCCKRAGMSDRYARSKNVLVDVRARARTALYVPGGEGKDLKDLKDLEMKPRPQASWPRTLRSIFHERMKTCGLTLYPSRHSKIASYMGGPSRVQATVSRPSLYSLSFTNYLQVFLEAVMDN